MRKIELINLHYAEPFGEGRFFCRDCSLVAGRAGLESVRCDFPRGFLDDTVSTQACDVEYRPTGRFTSSWSRSWRRWEVDLPGVDPTRIHSRANANLDTVGAMIELLDGCAEEVG